MATPVEITNPEIIGWYESTKGPIEEWYKKENERREDLKKANKTMLALLAGQMVLYLTQFLKNLDDRDDEIDHIIDFNEYLHDRKHGVDLDYIREKKGIINLALPEVNQCRDAVLHSEFTDGDVDAVNSMSEQFSKMSCGGVPDGWSLHEGEMLGAKAIADKGGLIANAARREREWFQKQKTNLMLSAQRNIKSPFKASNIMNGHLQAMNIYSGLADLYAQGFNSAGAGLGVLLGRMTATPIGGTQAESVNREV